MEEAEVNVLVGKMLDFLGVSEIFNASDSHKYFSNFIKHYIESINDGNIQKLGFYILSDNIWPDSLINPFCKALITVRKMKHIFDEDFYIKLSRRIEEKRQWAVSVRQIIPFYVLLKPAQQDEFLGLFESCLGEGRGKRWDLISTAYHWQMWNPETNKQTFQEFSEYVLSLSEKFPEYEISDDGHPIGETFQEWNDLYLLVHMIYAYKLFDLPIISRLHDGLKFNMFKWILKPDEFDYSFFELKWLLVFPGLNFLQVLKGNTKLEEAIDTALQKHYNSRVAELYHTSLKKDIV
jgi:hypothetical protein